MLTDISTTDTMDFAEQLRQQTAAVRLRRTKWGVSKSLDKQQKQMAADPFGASGDKLSASKKLIDTKHKKVKAVTSIFNRVGEHWKVTGALDRRWNFGWPVYIAGGCRCC